MKARVIATGEIIDVVSDSFDFNLMTTTFKNSSNGLVYPMSDLLFNVE